MATVHRPAVLEEDQVRRLQEPREGRLRILHRESNYAYQLNKMNEMRRNTDTCIFLESQQTCLSILKTPL